MTNDKEFAFGFCIILFCIVCGCGVVAYIHYNQLENEQIPKGTVIFSDNIVVFDNYMLLDSWGFAYWSFIDTQNRGYYTDVGHDPITGFKGPIKGNSYKITYYCNYKNERHIISMVDTMPNIYECAEVSGQCK